MYRFFLKKIEQSDEKIKISDPEQIHQIKNVLRLKPGKEIVIFDSNGQQFLMILKSINDNLITAKILKKIKQNTESQIKINLYQALLKKDNFEWIIKQGTCLGIDKFVPIITERTIVRQVSEYKLERWQKISQESAEQSGRTKIPTITQPIDFQSLEKQILGERALNLIGRHGDTKTLRRVLSQKKPEIINLFIGPEGGFSETETKLAQKLGLKSFRFGPRILRAELAGLAIVSAIFFHYQEF